MFPEETSVFSVECYFTMLSDIAKAGSGSSRALSELVEFIFPLPYLALIISASTTVLPVVYMAHAEPYRNTPPITAHNCTFRNRIY